MKSFLKTMLAPVVPYIPYLCIGIVILFFVFILYIFYQKRYSHLKTKRRRIEMLPSVISTLGVLGTFLGITIGLFYFEPNSLTTSIPELLGGLKTAFYTSLAGMLGSIILSYVINRIYDEDGDPLDIDGATNLICKSVSDLRDSIRQQMQEQDAFHKGMLTQMQTMLTAVASVATIYKERMDNIEGVVNRVEESVLNFGRQIDLQTEIKSGNAEIAKHILSDTSEVVKISKLLLSIMSDVSLKITRQVDALKYIRSSVDNVVERTDSLIMIDNAISTKISKQTDFVHDVVVCGDRLENGIKHSSELIIAAANGVSEKILEQTDKLHSDVVDIWNNMGETNEMLEKKFDDFAVLLRKNNTDALVEVMKRVTEQFESQMNALISKLVQENFDQLNKSVEKLNQWQLENKEMIKSLTEQYKQMADNFEKTSTTLSRVTDDAHTLVCEGGKLDTLVNSLNEVIVNDEVFTNASHDLLLAVEETKINMVSFDQSTSMLNDWVKKQRNFSDAVFALISKLQEISEMRDYASKFWSETKAGMNDAVGIVKEGTTQLNKQLTGLDKQFYARLSTTLAQLDACIQSLITKSEKRS